MSSAEAVAKLCAKEEAERKTLKPTHDVAAAKQVALDHFGVTVMQLSELDSYDDQNWRVVDGGGNAYVLKAHNGVEARDAALLDAQSALFARLSERGVRAPTEARPRVSSSTTSYRLLDWVDGDVLSKAEATPALLERSGAFLGRIRQALDDFDEEALHRTHLWDPRQFLAVATFSQKLTGMGCDAARAALVHRAIENYEARSAAFAELPRAVCHGDYNDANVLLRGDGDLDDDWGVLDVGDAVGKPARASAETSRGGAAAATWIFRGGGSRRRRGSDVDIPWR